MHVTASPHVVSAERLRGGLRLRGGAGCWGRLGLHGCLFVALVVALGCGESRTSGPAVATASARATASVSSPPGMSAPLPAPAPAALSGGPAAASASASASAPGPEDGGGACPANMVLVEGNYCPGVVQKCLEWHPEWLKEKARVERLRRQGKKASTSASERCLRYSEPSVCLSKKRRPLRFCMDRYEWPNEKGELPSFLVNWHDAVKSCRDVGKRLCTVDEFNFACEGEEMLPYSYGYVRDDKTCSIDKPYVRRIKSLKRYQRCIKDPACKAEMDRLDQREPIGSRPQCVSPFGAYDLNGNVNEWVRREGQDPPNRSGLKGGWWGPVRDRCRPTVGFHKEDDYGYEVGFRCCKEAAE